MLKDLIVISQEGFPTHEASLLNELLECGLQTLHLRKPKAEIQKMRKLLSEIEPTFHSRLVVHQHHELAKEFGLKGIHLTSTFRTKSRFWNESTFVGAARTKGLTVSTSIHSTVELRLVNQRYDYCFLSPVFDSISKTGHSGKLAEFKDLPLLKSSSTKVYALGGIDFENVGSLVETFFDGIALMGYIWQSGDPKGSYLRMRNKINEISGG